MNPIVVKDLHKHFGSIHVLRGLDFEVAPGEGTVLLGANGCGKSTLMRCLIGLERPDAGTAEVAGIDIATAGRRRLREVRRSVGMVFQRFNLVANLSVLQNVLFGALGRQPLGVMALASPWAPQEERDRAMHCLHRVGLADRAGQRADTLSGGQQQRVAIARMLMQAPRLVLADEPVASLDPRSGREVMDLLWEIVREEGMTVVCTLHQLDLAREYGDRLLGMKAGKIQLQGRISDFDTGSLESLYHGEVRVDGDPREEVPLATAASAS